MTTEEIIGRLKEIRQHVLMEGMKEAVETIDSAVASIYLAHVWAKASPAYDAVNNAIAMAHEKLGGAPFILTAVLQVDGVSIRQADIAIAKTFKAE